MDAIGGLVEQLGFAFREFYVTGGQPRRHIIPLWAWELTVVSVALVVFGLLVEWYIRDGRRKIGSKRSIPGLPVDSVRSKTHMIF